MPTVNYLITNTADDAVLDTSGPDGLTLAVVVGDQFGIKLWSAWRFLGVLGGAVPSGAVPTAATLSITHNSSGPFFGDTGNGTNLGRIYAADQANASSIVATAIDTMPKSDAFTAISFSSPTTTINVLAQVEEWMALPGWAAGNAIAFVGDPTTASANSWREFFDYETDSTKSAVLSITYEAGGPPTLADLTLSATIADTAANGTVAGTVAGRTASSTLSLTDDADGAFAIDSATGEITKAGTLSYLSSPYSITVRETLTGATNTPNDTTLSVTVTRGYVGPKWLGVGTVASGTGNITPALPASMAVGERMVLIAESANQAIAIPAGWSEVPGSPQGTGTAAGTAATRLAVFTRVYQSGDAAPTITDPGDHCIARIHRFEASTIGESAGNTASASTSGSMPSITTTADDALIVLCAAVATDTTAARFSAWTNAALENLTEQSDNATTQGNGGGIGLTTGEKITAGATGTTSFTAATSSVQGRLTFALYAPSAGPTRAPRSFAIFID